MYKIISGAAFFCLFMTACSIPVAVDVNLHYQPVVEKLKLSAAGVNRRGLHIDGIVISDNRLTKDNLGSMGAAIHGGDVTDWVRQGILYLSKYGYSFSGHNDKTGRLLKIGINRVSCRAILMHTRCTVLLEAELLSHDGAPLQKKSYYGTYLETKEIFSNFDEADVLQGLNGALEDSIFKLESDLRKMKNI